MKSEFQLLILLCLTALGFLIGFTFGQSVHFVVDGFWIELDLATGLLGMLIGFATARGLLPIMCAQSANQTSK